MPRIEESCWTYSYARAHRSESISTSTLLVAKVHEMMTILTSVLAAAYGSLASAKAMNLLRRGLVLFTVGVFLALVLNLLQIQRHVTLFPEEVIATIFSSAWWVPPCCGTAAGKEGELGRTGPANASG